MRHHDRFEWDTGKATINRKKHKVTFDDAAAVLKDDQADRFHLEEYDEPHSVDEDRYITTGSDPVNRRIILIISWTDRSADDARITHIISARAAIAHERKTYAQEIERRGE